MKAFSCEEFHRFKHETLTIKNPDIKNLNNIIDTFITEYDKTYDFYLIKYDFKLVYNKYENRQHLKLSLFDSQKSFLRKVC